MRVLSSLAKLIRDQSGAHLIEMTIVLPAVLLVSLGTVDVGLLLVEWAQANKATFVGARVAVVNDPIVDEVVALSWAPHLIGDSCANDADGTATQSGGANKCPTFSVTCTATAGDGGSCSGSGLGSYTFNPIAFNKIYFEMRNRTQWLRLDRQNVQITYEMAGLGFVGRPRGLPMSVTVSIRCMTHQMHFMGGLAGWIFTAPTGCAGVPGILPNSFSLPAFATTLTSEDMSTLDTDA